MERTIENLILAVRKLAADSPDCTYERPNASSGCYYHRGDCSNGSVGCIIGQAMRLCGVDMSDCTYWDGKGAIDGRVLNAAGFTDTTVDQLNWLCAVQRVQDDWKTWSQAVAWADSAQV